MQLAIRVKVEVPTFGMITSWIPMLHNVVILSLRRSSLEITIAPETVSFSQPICGLATPTNLGGREVFMHAFNPHYVPHRPLPEVRAIRQSMVCITTDSSVTRHPALGVVLVTKYALLKTCTL
jgi:hypothetical protein